MFIDAGLIFSDSQAMTTTAVSTSYVDQLASGDAIESGWLVATVSGILNAGTSIKVTLQHDSDAAFGTVTTLVDGPVLTTATVSAVGSNLLTVKIPVGAKRYLRVNYTIVGTYDTTSAVDASIVLHAQGPRFPAS